MNGRTRLFGSSRFQAAFLGLVLLGTGCSGTDVSPEPVAELSLAVNACDEEVPSERFIDGFPAYAQCDGVSSGSIYSNNGIDTSTTSLGDDWIQTQRGGGYQCTEWTYRYNRFRWGIHYRYGDAQEWCDGDLPDGLVISPTPVHGDLMIFAGGVCGADESTGHIVVIDTVDDAAQRVTFVEQNRAGRRSANQSCATCFLHAVANDGSSGGAGGIGAGGGAGAVGTGGSGGVGGIGMPGGSAGSGGTVSASGGASAGGNGGSAGASGGATSVGGGAGVDAAGGAGAISGTAGTGNVGVGGSVGGGGSGAPSSVGGMAGSTPNAGAPPVTNAGTAGTSSEPPVDQTNDTFAPPPETGCSVVSQTGSTSGGLMWIFSLLVGVVTGRRRGRHSRARAEQQLLP
jgi:hypothetical protein